ncbi:MAG: S1C family serine protease [Proteobacteria bacterium]|nr:S1C family serine protease [Pseudomonadota bacterium]
MKGLGTGFFLKESGLILTNLHVISKATDINIKGGDGRIYTPESVNFVDSTNDLALIKVKEKNLPGGLKLGDPNNVEEGDRVFVIGNPAGFELSLSEGIVSGKRNIDPLTKESRETIQITAPISPGSSGSPVFNKRGKVIGVASLGSKGEIQNINFASTIKPVMNYMAYVDRCYFKFLDRDSEWRYIDSIYTSNTTYSNYYFTNRDYYSFSFYYSPETFTHVNEDVVTVWLNIKGNITTRIESNFFEYLYKDTITKGDFYLLVEVNCKDKVYKNRISFTYFDNQLTKVVDDFSDEGWSDLNQTIINKICSLREN